MAAESAVASTERRELYIDRRVCTVTPDRIDVHPARSIIVIPIFGLLLGILAFPTIYFLGSSLPLWLLVAMTFGALILVPVSGMGLVYSITGAHLVIERHKQSAVLQQGFLGMGVGTQELIPFWKIDRIQVQELTPHDYRGHQDDFAQYEVVIVKVSGKEVPIGTVTVARAEAEAGQTHAREVASLVAEMAGTSVRVLREPQDEREPKRVEA